LWGRYRRHRHGAVDVHALGSLLLSQARQAGVMLLKAEIENIEQAGIGYRVSFSGQPLDRFPVSPSPVHKKRRDQKIAPFFLESKARTYQL